MNPIAEYSKANKISIADMAGRIGKKPIYLYQITCGARFPSGAEAMRISREFGIQVERLLNPGKEKPAA